MKKKALMLILMLVFTTNTVFASEGNWKILPGNYKESLNCNPRFHTHYLGYV